MPELANLPAKYIYEPWTANIGILDAAGVKLGTNYPRPIVDHAVVSKENMTKISLAYQMHNDRQAAAKNNDKKAEPPRGAAPPPKKKIKKQTKII